jgi:hypothetical protein
VIVRIVQHVRLAVSTVIVRAAIARIVQLAVSTAIVQLVRRVMVTVVTVQLAVSIVIVRLVRDVMTVLIHAPTHSANLMT